MLLDPEIAALVATTRRVVSRTHQLTTDMNRTLDDLEEFAERRAHLLEETEADE